MLSGSLEGSKLFVVRAYTVHTFQQEVFLAELSTLITMGTLKIKALFEGK